MNLKICYGKKQNTITDIPNSWNVTKKRDKVRRLDNLITRNRKHRRAAAKPAACAPNVVNTREQGKEGGMVR